MDPTTGYTQMGMQLVAGDPRPCAGFGLVSTERAWQASGAFAADARATKPATRMLIDVPATHRHRRLRSSP